MAAQVDPFPTAEALAHPAFAPLRPWIEKLASDPGRASGAWPSVEVFNAFVARVGRTPIAVNGNTLRFCLPNPSSLENSAASYETRVFSTGQVDTRRANLHDLFNALVWLAFPRTKAALNARHVARLAQDGARRGSLRDTLTLIDEGGVIVACAENFLAEAESLIRLFRWQELFWERRVEMLRNSRFVLVGHSAYEKALKPYPGITCKALFIATPPALIDGPSVELTQWLDDAAEKWITNLPDTAAPRQMAPLPVFGYPGWLAEAKGPGFYADRRWFRAAPAPSGRGSAEKLERVP